MKARSTYECIRTAAMSKEGIESKVAGWDLRL
jgi:hypothetical protein